MKNERWRYLADCLMWHLDFLDGIFIYDDQSTDGGDELARQLGAVVETRPPDAPSFLQHEGDFRQAGYEAFELALQPLPGDWVLSFDFDEFLVSDGGEREALIGLADLVDENFPGCNAVDLHFEEIFDIAGDKLYSRIDGFWADINAPRLFRYDLGGHIPNRAMGCGSVPSYVRAADYTPVNLRMLHFGYATADDRENKYDRYTAVGNNGHNPAHIASIVAVPTCVPWNGTMPW